MKNILFICIKINFVSYLLILLFFDLFVSIIELIFNTYFINIIVISR